MEKKEEAAGSEMRNICEERQWKIQMEMGEFTENVRNILMYLLIGHKALPACNKYSQVKIFETFHPTRKPNYIYYINK